MMVLVKMSMMTEVLFGGNDDKVDTSEDLSKDTSCSINQLVLVNNWFVDHIFISVYHLSLCLSFFLIFQFSLVFFPLLHLFILLLFFERLGNVIVIVVMIVVLIVIVIVKIMITVIIIIISTITNVITIIILVCLFVRLLTAEI